jgi:2-methylcitrate dehydratase PrpD
LNSFTQEARARRDVRDLMKKVSAREDTGLPPFAVRINTRLNSGKKYSGEYFYAKGHPQKPFTEKELVDKFKKCLPYSAYKLEDAAVNTIINSAFNLEKIDSVTDCLLNPLVPV